MATLLLHPCPPGPSKGILLNPSPGASPAYHPASLPALIPSNSSLSSSASSLAPGDSSDYFSKSSSPSPGPSHSSPSPNNAPLRPHAKPRTDPNPSTVRRIRFAPLPEPRRDDDVYDAVFDDDDDVERPLTMHSALATAGVSLTAPADADLAQSLTSSPFTARKCLPSECLPFSSPRDDCSGPSEPEAQHSSECGHDRDFVRSPSPASHPGPSSAPGSPRKGGKLAKMFAPLLGRSGRSHSSPLAMFSAEDVSAMNGDAHRGRRNSNNSGHGHRTESSRESSVSRERSGTDFGAPLYRWTSEGAPGAGLPLSTKKRLSLFGGGGSGGGVPLGRTQSLTSLSGKDDKKGKPAAGAVPQRAGGRKQTRMLNGRVYGAKRNPNANPFANVRTEEPEFVEWGYGGMGSVKNAAGQSSVWSRVQADNTAAGIARKVNEDEDDGSGMAWIKRRKEKKEAEERAKKEQEAREKAAEANAENADVEMNTESEVTDAKETDTETDVEVEAEAKAAEAGPVERIEKSDEAEHAPMSPNATVTLAPAPSTLLASEGQKSPAHLEHVTQAISIPAQHRHHHSHSHSHTLPHHHHAHTLSLSRIDTRESGETVRPFGSPPKGQLATPEHESAEQASLHSSGASTASEDGEDGEDGDSEDSPKDSGFGNEDDSEEDDEDQVRSRLTALSAGVEKIARHHKDEQGPTATGTPAETSS